MTEEIKAKRDELAELNMIKGGPELTFKNCYQKGFDTGFAIGLLNREVNSIHTCHKNCQRVACAQRREIEKLKEASKGLLDLLHAAAGYIEDPPANYSEAEIMVKQIDRAITVYKEKVV